MKHITFGVGFLTLGSVFLAFWLFQQCDLIVDQVRTIERDIRNGPLRLKQQTVSQPTDVSTANR